MNSQERKEYNRLYRQNNKEKVKESCKVWRDANKDYFSNYYIKNKDNILKQQQTYIKENEKKIKKPHSCACGGKYQHKNRIQHLKTNKHQQYLRQSPQTG
jgi:hypothetical protein